MTEAAKRSRVDACIHVAATSLPDGSRIARLPSAIACLVFSWLPCADNLRLASCARSLQRVSKLSMASPLVVEVTDYGGADPAAVMAHVAGTMLPRCLAIRLSHHSLLVLDVICGTTSLRSLVLDCRRLPSDWNWSRPVQHLSRLTRLTDLTVRQGPFVPQSLINSVAQCTALVQLHLEFDGRDADLGALAALVRLESLTLQGTPLHGSAELALAKLASLTELRLLRDVSGMSFFVHDELGDWATRLRRLTLQGQLSRNLFRSLVPLAPTLTALDFAYDATDLPLSFVRQLTRLEELALRYPPGVVRRYSKPLEELAVLSRLCILTLDCAAHWDLTNLELLPASLTELHLECCLGLASLAGLTARIPLRTLRIVHCSRLQDIRGFIVLAPSLTSLAIVGPVSVYSPVLATNHHCVPTHVNPLTSLTALRLDDCYNEPRLAARLRRLAFGTDACPTT